MTIKDILMSSGGALVLLMTLVQISPIKIDPWSWIARQFGNAINKNLTEKIDNISESVTKLENQVTNLESNLDTQIKCIGNQVRQLDDKVHIIDESLLSLDARVEESEKKNDENNIMVCRARILRFGDEILHGQKHSKEHFDQILLDCTMYENYCERHPGFKNNIAGATIDMIKSTYNDCMKNKTFL